MSTRSLSEVQVVLADDVSDRQWLTIELQNLGATVVPEEKIGSHTYVVLSDFSGPSFEKFRNQDCKLIGIPMVLDCIDRQLAFPPCTTPTFSTALEGISVCCSGKMKELVRNYVTYMGGTYQRELRVNTQYLIASDVYSLKYQFAVKKKIPVLSSVWIERCWEHNALVDPSLFVLPPFAGCIVSVTGFSTGMKNMIKQLITIYGGEFSPNLSKRCTHLIAVSSAGVKYRYAKSIWDIPVVSLDWLMDSLTLGACAYVPNYFVNNVLSTEDNAIKLKPFQRHRIELTEEASSQSLVSEVEQLITAIDNVTSRVVNVSTVCSLLSKSEATNSANLRKVCIEFIAQNYRAVVKHDAESVALFSMQTKKDLEDKMNEFNSIQDEESTSPSTASEEPVAKKRKTWTEESLKPK